MLAVAELLTVCFEVLHNVPGATLTLLQHLSLLPDALQHKKKKKKAFIRGSVTTQSLLPTPPTTTYPHILL